MKITFKLKDMASNERYDMIADQEINFRICSLIKKYGYNDGVYDIIHPAIKTYDGNEILALYAEPDGSGVSALVEFQSGQQAILPCPLDDMPLESILNCLIPQEHGC